MKATVQGASESFARTLFTRGTDIFGAREIKDAFGIEISDVPPIPFTEEELIAARPRGESLIFQPADVTMKSIYELTGNKTSDGKKLLYDISGCKNEAFFEAYRLRYGWRLTSQEVISISRGRGYLGQTQALANHLKETVFAGIEMVESATLAVIEFEKEKQELEILLSNDWEEAARRMVALKINEKFRETPVEVFFRLALYERINGVRLLPSKWTWTNVLSSRGDIINLGRFNEYGVSIYGGGSPRDSFGNPGVCFSRS